jgi:hypothetical protein
VAPLGEQVRATPDSRLPLSPISVAAPSGRPSDVVIPDSDNDDAATDIGSDLSLNPSAVTVPDSPLMSARSLRTRRHTLARAPDGTPRTLANSSLHACPAGPGSDAAATACCNGMTGSARRRMACCSAPFGDGSATRVVACDGEGLARAGSRTLLHKRSVGFKGLAALEPSSLHGSAAPPLRGREARASTAAARPAKASFASPAPAAQPHDRRPRSASEGELGSSIKLTRALTRLFHAPVAVPAHSSGVLEDEKQKRGRRQGRSEGAVQCSKSVSGATAGIRASGRRVALMGGAPSSSAVVKTSGRNQGPRAARSCGAWPTERAAEAGAATLVDRDNSVAGGLVRRACSGATSGARRSAGAGCRGCRQQAAVQGVAATPVPESDSDFDLTTPAVWRRPVATSSVVCIPPHLLNEQSPPLACHAPRCRWNASLPKPCAMVSEALGCRACMLVTSVTFAQGQSSGAPRAGSTAPQTQAQALHQARWYQCKGSRAALTLCKVSPPCSFAGCGLRWNSSAARE